MLGVNPDEDYHAATCRLEAAATVILYTDGVVEAENPAGRSTGWSAAAPAPGAAERGARGSRRAHPRHPEQRQSICNNRELLDDVTLVALRTTAAAVATAV